MSESASDQGDLPALFAAEEVVGGARAVSGTASNQCLVLTSQLPGTWVWFCKKI